MEIILKLAARKTHRGKIARQIVRRDLRPNDTGDSFVSTNRCSISSRKPGYRERSVFKGDQRAGAGMNFKEFSFDDGPAHCQLMKFNKIF